MKRDAGTSLRNAAEIGRLSAALDKLQRDDPGAYQTIIGDFAASLGLTPAMAERIDAMVAELTRDPPILRMLALWWLRGDRRAFVRGTIATFASAEGACHDRRT
jgi:hypothetical protein